MTKLSIIVPVYNVEKYIRPCFESIFRQGLDDNDYEIIIVNDGTKDRSMEMIADLISQHHNITVINQENQGVSVARNNGIAKAKGKYIFMPDSDDLLIDNSLPILLEKALKSKVDILVADFLESKSDDIEKLRNINQIKFEYIEKNGEELFLDDLNPYQCYVWRSLFRNEFIRNNKLSFVPGVYYQDVPFTHKAYIKSKKCIRTSWKITIYRRERQGAATFSFSKKKARDLCIVISETWNLTNISGLSPATINKIKDDVFVSFSLFCSMLVQALDLSDIRETLSFLKIVCPNLHFTNGFKQRLVSSLYNTMPFTYILLRQYYGRLFEDYLIPHFHHLKYNLLELTTTRHTS